MQLLLIMLLLAAGGGNITDQLKPLLESVGGENLKSMIDGAEGLAEVLEAVQTLAPAVKTQPQPVQSPPSENIKSDGFPLSAVADFANDDVLCALTNYLSGQ